MCYHRWHYNLNVKLWYLTFHNGRTSQIQCKMYQMDSQIHNIIEIFPHPPKNTNLRLAIRDANIQLYCFCCYKLSFTLGSFLSAFTKHTLHLRWVALVSIIYTCITSIIRQYYRWFTSQHEGAYPNTSPQHFASISVALFKSHTTSTWCTSPFV